MTPAQLQNRRILVVGAGLTGLSVVRFLRRQSLPFTLAHEGPLSDTASELLAGETILTQFDAAQFSAFDLLVLSPGIPRRQPAVAAAIAAGVDVIGDIELYAGVVDRPVIAVTGSNGKSTVVAWLAHVLDTCGRPAVACGNFGLPALDALLEDADFHVLELSSYQLESLHRLEAVSAVVLNVSDDHMDRYDSLEHYAATKRRIFQAARHPVANRDDQRTWPQAPTVTDSHRQAPAPVVWFSLDPQSSADFSIVELDGERWLQAGGEALLRQSGLQMPGDHNTANALAILALLQPLGLPRQRCLQGLAGFRGLPHRTELVATHRDVRWYNDSKGTNVDACAKAISAMSGAVILIAGGQGKGADFRVLRPLAERAVKSILLLGEDADRLAEALRGCAPLERVTDMHEAVARAAVLAGPGDVVLLSPACASFDMFSSYADRGECFRQAVLAVVQASADASPEASGSLSRPADTARSHSLEGQA